uniref:3',5'-cyclic-AMP phosphodiesterase n=1 Tax=Ditylenchus dipsaci TaxID=166011 RepID=A0A915D7W1_9BILA
MGGRQMPSSSSTSGLAGGGGHHLGIMSGMHARRESFLYRGDEREPLFNAALLGGGRPVSRASSVASSDPQHGDDFIVTPFAQLLASLRNVRSNLVAIANLPQPVPSTSSAGLPSMPVQTGEYRQRRSDKPALTALPEPVQLCAQETLEELDWCLDQLEAIQIHRSVTEMASSKFRKLLNKELSQFAESSKSGTQISKFLINTYMEDRNEDENNLGNIDNNMTKQQNISMKNVRCT